MFMECKSLSTLDISRLIVNSVEDFTNMFKDCESLISLDLSSFNTWNSKKIKGIFESCRNLEYLKLGDKAHFEGITNYASVFSGTRNLVIYSDCDKIKEIIEDNDCISMIKDMNWKNSLKRYDIETN